MQNKKLSKLNWNAFYNYKNKHKGEIAVVCGTGETLNSYQPLNAIHIGCNNGVFYDKIVFDYFFFNDCRWGSQKLKDAIKNYQPNIQKFIGVFTGDAAFGCGLEFAMQSNALWYDSQGPIWTVKKPYFSSEINQHPLGDKGGSTIFYCMQFALFCGFSEINIVGCDITGSKHFHRDNRRSNLSHLKHKWKLFKEFINHNHKNIKINVINPLGLKGYFNDIQQY